MINDPSGLVAARKVLAIFGFFYWGLAEQDPKVVAETIQQDRHPVEIEELFVRRIEPLFSEKCWGCHGKDETNRKGGFSMATREAILMGGDSGVPGLSPKNPEESPIFLAITRQHGSWSSMPPKEADKLSEEQISWVRHWIEGSAAWPDKARSAAIRNTHFERWASEDGVSLSTRGGLSDSWNERRYSWDALWAYRPVTKPETKRQGSAAIDEWISQRIDAELPTAPPATPHELIRRLSFDLTGLPPSLESIAQFTKEYQENPDGAVRRIIDRYLESPHYGERMGQHWLDVVRYADSSGFSNDYERGNAWRYRDYVVRAMNEDRPFDRFLREQIAGDEIDPSDPEMIIATGFLRMGPWELTGMEVAKIARQRFLDDVTNSVGETFLAQSLQCARCHDHKFDPIPTRDYYAFQAVFATTQLVERSAPFLPSENTEGFEESKYLEMTRTEHQATLNRLDAKSLEFAEAWLRDQKIDPSKWHEAVEKARSNGAAKRRGVFGAARNLMLKEGLSEDQIPPRMLGWSPEEIGLERIANKGIERLGWQFDRYQPFAMAVYNGWTPSPTSVTAPIRMPKETRENGELEKTAILTGGDPFSPGDEVAPGVLSVLESVRSYPSSGPSKKDSDLSSKTILPSAVSGRRMALADWIAHPDNPLTTRAIVNRIWMWHFDQPLAGNPNNFGSTGKKPTHPELLDWLAATFVEKGWSVKEMHRLILNSQTYRRSASALPVEKIQWREKCQSQYALFKPRRLSAEEIRDAMLWITGELNPNIGGIPNRPEIHLEIAMQPRQVMGTFAAAWLPNPLPSQRHRRSLYALKLRGLPIPFLEVFNAPTPDFSCERRDVSTITPQVFSLLNSQETRARSLALAARALRESNDDSSAIERCFHLAFGRLPSDEERKVCLDHWNLMKGLESTEPPPKRELLLEVRRDALEENTGERFSFSEKLYSNQEFVPDLQPSDCDLRTRSLAHVCLMLFNANEFIYVY